MAPLIVLREFTLLRRRVQLALGFSVRRVEPLEGEIIPDLPQLRSHRLWEDWQRDLRRRATRGTHSELGM